MPAMDETNDRIWTDAEASHWSVDPERVDPDDYAPGRVFVKVMTWAPCDDCQIQVHSPASQFLLRGISCPRCERLLLPAPPDALDRLQSLLRQEDELAEQL
jgi:hypothetical protein